MTAARDTWGTVLTRRRIADVLEAAAYGSASTADLARAIAWAVSELRRRNGEGEARP